MKYQGIVKTLLTRLPAYNNYVRGSKENQLYKAFQRPTINWSLDCEKEEKSRQDVLDFIKDVQEPALYSSEPY
jgi:hypothetical protein